jgi:hypothetical protein
MSISRASRRAFLLGVALYGGAGATQAQEPFAPRVTDIASAFFIAKSENRNQVHYGVRVDRDCRPIGEQPVFAYWRMLEHGGEVEPLLDHEVPAYGVLEQRQVQPLEPLGAAIAITLRALPRRVVTVNVRRGAGRCEAEATTVIAGTAARLRFIYARLAWPFGIDYLLLRGRRLDDGRVIEETLRQ